MPVQRHTLLTLLALNVLSISASTIPHIGRTPESAAKPPKSKYPFNELVVFGDQFSDNGNGSFAHGLDPQNIYQYHTWTDGPIASSYLADLLGVPELNFAWGGSNGAGLFGSTVDNSYTPAVDTYKGKPVPSTQQQIFNNYTRKGAPANIENALQFIWIGQNDLKNHTDWWEQNTADISPTDARNTAFYNNFTSLLLPQVERLISLGAPAVLVVNLPPLQTSPMCKYFLCKTRTACYSKWAAVIEAANTHLQTALQASQYASKIIYYDVYAFWTQMMKNKNSYGFTQPLDFFCDGNHSLPDNKWTQCTADLPSWAGARPYFYFTNDQPETHGHQFIAQDMQNTINAHFGINS